MQLTKNVETFLVEVPVWIRLSVSIILLHLLLSVLMVIGVYFLPNDKGNRLDSSTIYFPHIWRRWDSGYYLDIAFKGYQLHDDKLAFFPLYPLLIRYASFGNTSLGEWSGFVISNIAIILSAILLFYQVKLEHGLEISWLTLITIMVFPTAFFFSAIYTESLFLLFSILVYWYAYREKYVLAAVFVSLASLTRVNGLLLIFIPLVEIVIRRPKDSSGIILQTLIVSGIGLGVYTAYLWVTQGSPFAFFAAQANWKRSITWPWLSVWDAVQVILGRIGTPSDWFMRVISLQDFLSALVLILSTIFSYKLLRRSLFIYMVGASILLLISHGPLIFGLWSMSRFIIVLFPIFTLAGILLQKLTKLKYLFWSASSLLLVFYSIWFASGRWVG